MNINAVGTLTKGGEGMKKLVSIIAALSIIFSGAVSPAFAAQCLKLDDESLDSVVAGQDEINELTLEGNAQRFFKGVSNANTVDSASLVQSNVAVVSGGTSSLENLTDPEVINSDSYFEHGSWTVDNTLTVRDIAQSGEDGTDFFAALSNLNTVDSASAVQSNITTGIGEKDSSNSAAVTNSDGDKSRCGFTTNNTLTLEGAVGDGVTSAQERLWALSNANTVDSANAVQSNIISGAGLAGTTNESINDAMVSNQDGNGEMCGIETNNELSLTHDAQAELIALSNLNTVDSANAVQSNITKGSATNDSRNSAVVENNDGEMTRAGRSTTNELNIKDNAQHDLIALSNLNTVDSANAVQSNITVFSGSTNYSSNNATVTNSDGTLHHAGEGEDNEVLSLGEEVQKELTALSNVNSVDSANAVQSNITVNTSASNIDNDSINLADVNNIDALTDAAHSSGDNEMTLSGSAQGALRALSNINTVDSANAVQSNITENELDSSDLNVGDIDNYSKNEAYVTNEANEGKNKMVLTENAQQGLLALSNLNTLASASAVQSNITTNSLSSCAGAGDVTNYSENYADVDNSSSYGDYEDELRLARDNDVIDYPQAGLRALSNINSANSANAVQSNITSTTSTGRTVGDIENDSINEADVTNQSGEGENGNNKMILGEHAQEGLHALSNLNTIGSASAVQSNITRNSVENNAPGGYIDNYSENLANVDNSSGSGTEDKIGFQHKEDWEDYNFPQAQLCALSNINTVNSANAVQSNITNTSSTGTAAVGTIDNESINEAYVENTTDGPQNYGARNNKMNLDGNAQEGLCALSNLNTLSSANAVQSNITVNSVGTGGTGSITNKSYNYAGKYDDAKDGVKNTSGYSALNKLELGRHQNGINDCPQSDLRGLSNINTVDSANAVQSNITLNSGSSDACPTAGLGLDIKWDGLLVTLPEVPDEIPCCCPHVPTPEEDITITYPGDFEVTGVCGATITFGSASGIADIDNYSYNYAEVYNDAGRGSGWDELYIVEGAQSGLHALSNLNTVHAANAVQSNITVNVGDTTNGIINWSRNYAVVTNQRRLGSDYLYIEDNAQENLSALSNLNAVESATSVQSNITVTSGETGTVTNTSSNYANVINDNNNSDWEPTGLDYKDSILSLSGSAQQSLTALSNVNSVASATVVQSSITVSSGTGVTSSINTAHVTNF